MFVPHGRENAEFGEAWLAPDDFKDALIFIGAEAVGGNQIFGDGWLLHVVVSPVVRPDGGPQLLAVAAPHKGKGGAREEPL